MTQILHRQNEIRQCHKGGPASLLGGVPESEYVGGARFPPSTVVLVPVAAVLQLDVVGGGGGGGGAVAAEPL